MTYTNGNANGHNGHAATPTPAATRLRKMLTESDELIVMPGVYDGFSARIALEVGFDGLYMTGAGTCASKLGQPDLGFASLNDMREHAEMIANLNPRIPLIADADTGYGGPNMVARTVAQYHRSGVAGLHIEDQIQTKRCGHLGGKEVVSVDVFQQRISAAAAARDKLASDIVIIARTDALQTHGFEEAIRRLKAAAAAGADVAFLEGVTTKEEAREVCLAEARELGFRIIIYPFAALAPAYEAIRSTYLRIKETGVTDIDPTFTPKKLFTVVGLKEATAVDVAAGGQLYEKV
ncbi:phosphoenolpyruvate phosphomutase domain-containing protein [Trichoderma breve]|uniref:Phosphoenolpyruvate phosphomutase domain-containing protein n=1 Tax=Trichoderma breve TaxID=2034170 RepID=A0A9W9E9L7_9HYPO|nr:phosphoenolpyruvate phosphomutase domain-containing protein [Trichoderma breve]KAJ4860031.1 phosphoenolpyruvate phosphomutase domain-containing protein [Trichoderma breve]